MSILAHSTPYFENKDQIRTHFSIYLSAIRPIFWVELVGAQGRRTTSGTRDDGNDTQWQPNPPYAPWLALLS